MRLKIMLLILSIAMLEWAGCFLLPADGVLDLTGAVVGTGSERPSDCVLTLQTAEGDDLDFQDIQARFTANFVVSPSRQRYRAEISCSGYAPYTTAPFWGPSSYSGPPTDLGELTLEPDGHS